MDTRGIKAANWTKRPFATYFRRDRNVMGAMF